ncbi:MAG: InlB B-repeat-containing protein [Spirochaetales bacterium]|nr:InlB B-repeat-containing protein [Spirochaetales bacterium]
MKKIIGFITIVMVLIGLFACDTEQSGSIENGVPANTSNDTSNQSGDDSSSSASDSSSSSDDSSNSSSQSGDDSSSSASDSSSSSDDSSSASSQSGDDSSSSQEPPIIQYTVVFDANGGTGEMANQTFIYDESQDLNNCSFTPPTGHQFGGWNTAANGQGDKFANNAAVKNLTAVNNDTVTLYAQWVANQYQIIYKDWNNEEFIHGATYPTVYIYDKSAELDTPHKDGYEFAGYHLRPNCSDDAITTLAASTYTDDIILYAKWIIGNGTITMVIPTYQDVDDLLSYSDDTFTALSDYQTYSWYIDSKKQSNSTSTFTPNTSSLSAGTHSVTVMVTDDQGDSYSAVMTFQVRKSY